MFNIYLYEWSFIHVAYLIGKKLVFHKKYVIFIQVLVTSFTRIMFDTV